MGVVCVSSGSGCSGSAGGVVVAAVGGGAAEMVGDEGVVETSVAERKVAETPPFFAGPLKLDGAAARIVVVEDSMSDGGRPGGQSTL